jgi:hypothetical protein
VDVSDLSPPQPLLEPLAPWTYDDAGWTALSWGLQTVGWTPRHPRPRRGLAESSAARVGVGELDLFRAETLDSAPKPLAAESAPSSTSTDPCHTASPVSSTSAIARRAFEDRLRRFGRGRGLRSPRSAKVAREQ